MKRLALLLLLWPAMAWADAPKVEPGKIECEPRDLIQFKVSAEAGKTIVSGELPADKFVVFEIKPGVFVAQPQKNASGTYTLQFWHAGDTVTLPKVGPLPALPVATLTVVVGGEQPKPKPPEPKPVDPPADVIPTEMLRVLIVEESAERSKLSTGVLTSMFAVPVRDAIKAASGDIRVVDKDDDLSREHAFYREAFKRSQGKTLPYAVIGNGRQQWEGAVPNGYLQMIEQVKKIGGGA